MKEPMPTDLFDTNKGAQEPLASRMRPRTIAEYIGQEHIMGPGRLLRRAIQADQLSSIIFSGPPGTGKTTLARVIAGSTTSEFVSLNAVLSGVNEIREAIENAKNKKAIYDRRTILFVDEVHRWNKAQQDALLPWVENGTFILIGATTENPYFEVNAALVSRSRVFQLKALSELDLRAIAAQALADPLRGYGRWKVQLDADALDHLVATASGDARSLLNALELAVETTPASWPPAPGADIVVSLSVAEESIQQKALLYDRDGDYHYDAISAFIKSIRGSDPDAALYWMARMIRAGESPRFVFRRMMISASEDVGMADPQALIFVQNAASAFDRVGMPEGQFFLTHAVLYLATAPKSNSALGYFDALKALETEELAEVPNHLKDSNRDKKGFGHGEGYQYPHAFRDHWVAQNYLPGALQGKLFYQPGDLGYEGALRTQILARREMQLAEAKIEKSTEHLTWSPADQRLEHFARRAEARDETWLRQIREKLFELLAPARHERIAVLGAESGFLVPEALRRVPEGLVYVLQDAAGLELVRHQVDAAAQMDRCRLLPFAATTGTAEPGDSGRGWVMPVFTDGPAEKAVSLNLLVRCPEAERPALLASLHSLTGVTRSPFSPAATFVCAEQIPARAPRLSALVPPGAKDAALLARVAAAEEAFYATLPSRADIESWIGAVGRPTSSDVLRVPRTRTLRPAQIAAWFSGERPGSYGSTLRASLGESDFSAWSTVADRELRDRTVEWPLELLVVRLELGAPEQA